MSTPVVLYGASELARDAVSIFPALSAAGTPRHFLGFVDDGPDKEGKSILGYPVLGPGAWLIGRVGEVEVLLAIGEPRVRRRIARMLADAGHTFALLVHPSVQSTPWVALGPGTVVMASCSFTVDITVGEHVVFNPGCTVAHDVEVGDFAYISPGVDLAGGVRVEEGAYLGTGATVLPQRRIGAGAMVGAGAVVTRDVPANTVYAGVPARKLRDADTPWGP